MENARNVLWNLEREMSSLLAEVKGASEKPFQPESKNLRIMKRIELMIKRINKELHGQN